MGAWESHRRGPWRRTVGVKGRVRVAENALEGDDRQRDIHRESKKHVTKLLFISSPNIDRF